MLINPCADGEARPASDQQDVSQQKYETMQCFAVSEPKSMKEEGEGILSNFDVSSCLSSSASLSCFFFYPLILSPLIWSLFCHFRVSQFVSVFLDVTFLSSWCSSFSCVDFLSFSHHFFHLHFSSLLCSVLFSSLLSACPPIHRQRLISVWHFVIFPSYLITHKHTREKNLSGILILDVWQPDNVPISPPTGGGCLVDRRRGCRLRLRFRLMLKQQCKGLG